MDGQQMMLKFNENFDNSLMKEVLKIVEINELVNISNEKNKLVLVSKYCGEDNNSFVELSCFFVDFQIHPEFLKHCLEWKWLNIKNGNVFDEENVLEEINL